VKPTIATDLAAVMTLTASELQGGFLLTKKLKVFANLG